MNVYTKRIILSIFFTFLNILFCSAPENPFHETDNVNLIIEVPKQPGGFNHCVNDTVRFNVTLEFPHLVQKVSVFYDENGDKEFRDITTDSPKDQKLSFAYEYKEKGLKNVKFTIILNSGDEKIIPCDTIDIGVKPTIRHEKNLLVGGDIILGKSLILTVDHDQFSKAEYKWYKDLKLLQGQEQQSLIFNNLAQSDTGQYYCVVSTAWGTDQSKTYILNFKNTLKPPKIVKHPQSVQVTEGSTVNFIIKASGEQLSYQWQKNDIDISGANDTIFELQNLSVGDSANLRCIVSNNSGSDTSENAVLKIFIDELAPKITKQPDNQIVDVGDTARFTVVSDGTNLKYQWYKNDEKIDDAVLPIYEIYQVSSGEDGQEYHCIVSNDKGNEESNKVLLTVKNISKPTIKEHPKNQEVTEGNEAQFSVEAEGDGVKYQWQKNQKDINGATESAFTYKNAKKDDSGLKFRCIVSNSAGSVTSDEAVLKVNTKVIAPKITKQPKKVTVKEGEQATFSVTAEGTNLTYQWSKNGKNISGADKSTYKIASVSKGDNGAAFTCEVKNSAGSAGSDEAELTVHYGPKITKQPKSVGVKAGKKATFSVEVTKGNPEKTNFQWYKGSSKVSGETGNELVVTAEKGDDGNTYSCKISNDAGFEVESKAAELTVYFITIKKDLSSSLTVKEGKQVKLEIAADAGSGGIEYQWFEDGNEINGQNKSSYSFTAKTSHDNKEYKCRAVNTAEKSVYVDSKTLTLSVEKNQEKPSITKNLSTSKTVEDGEQVRLEIEAECNTSDIEYQWYEDGSKLSGETKRSYTFKAGMSLDGNKYKCRVYNATDKTLYVDSKELKLTVKKRPKPTIKITSPGTESVVQYNKKITIKANVTGADITVKYYLDSESQLLGEGSSDGSYSWTPKKTGVHTVIGKVTDSYGTAKDNITVITVAGMKPIPPSKPQFWMDSVEVTQKEFEQKLRKNYSAFIGNKRPIGSITWYDAILYCNARSKAYGLDTCYSYSSKKMSGDTCKKLENIVFNDSKTSFCLPKLSEWKTAYYAGGSSSKSYYWGDDTTDIATINRYAWSVYNSNVNGDKTTQPVAQKKPNNWGLYDMSGNAFEWCWDFVGADGHYAIGGDYYWGANFLQPATNNWTYGNLSLSAAGFRVILHEP